MSSTAGAGELAPSDTRAESPTLIRYLVGFGGLFVFTLGVASVVAAQFGSTPGCSSDCGANW